MTNELRIAFIGNVDSGKSTLIGVLVTDKLDNGRGKVRESILNFPHEKKSGRTSTITQKYIKINENRSLVCIDLAGHEKYLKTTLHGLIGYYIDYSMILVGGNMGVSRMTLEHLSIAVSLKLPSIIVITKIDITPKNILENTIDQIRKLVRRCTKKKKKIFIVTNENLNKLNNLDLSTHFPVFCISNKTGDFIKELRKYIYQLPDIVSFKNNKELGNIFTIETKYQVQGAGTVVTGRVLGGSFNKNDKLYLGPVDGKWINVIIRSFHNNYRTCVNSLSIGESGCISIRPINKKDDFKNKKFKKGLFLLGNKDLQNLLTYKFTANVNILESHSTTIKKDYEPIINCNKIVQTAKICNIDKEAVRAGDNADITFKFNHRPEFMSIGDKFIFIEGRTRGIGSVISINN